jgi:1,4-alpha-glucan branching enzyme
MQTQVGELSVTTLSHDVTLLTDEDIYLFNEGTHTRLYDKLGAHVQTVDGIVGTYFATWAPNAAEVFVIGDFNNWHSRSHPLRRLGMSGIWEGFVPGVTKGAHYKYHIVSNYHGYQADKADPYASYAETPPRTASIVWDLAYEWGDGDWIAARQQRNRLDAPIAIYELHLGSWKRAPEEHNCSLSYHELADELVAYVARMGFTHVELMPITEHPFFGSWGYQTTGYFAPTSRYGAPQDLMYLIDRLHQQNIGVILDWVPSHFTVDDHGLGYFDGTHLYEHADARKGYHPDWGSLIFNYGRNEVRSFLLSSALLWLSAYHIDALRVDAVASMLYLDYSRQNGDWIPNRYGGRENLEAIDFLRRLNQEVYATQAGAQTIAEESTAWPLVSRPVDVGGLGFGLKWDMGWMHDTLDYMSHDPLVRRYYHNKLTFRMLYAFNENFVLPLSHDEVVHMKGSLLNKMRGDDWQKFANVRLLYGYMYGQPGKKLLFMGGEFGQWSEWNHDSSLDWHLTDLPMHTGMQRWVADLNRLYCEEPALHELDCDPSGFEWIEPNDYENSVLSFIRKGRSTMTVVLVVCNFTPVPRYHYRVGVPYDGYWQEALNSDAREFGGSGMGNLGGVHATGVPAHYRLNSLELTLPPLSVLFLRTREEGRGVCGAR